jgi:predicted DNA-binding protein YlxM (UPF0122 family)
MEKDFEIIELFEIYKGLLTKKQVEIFSAYYYYDLSLSEIAEPDGNSRQSVYSTVNKVKKKLLEFEKLLGVAKKNKELTNLANEVNSESISQRIKEIIGR